jgi:hypothetical protein
MIVETVAGYTLLPHQADWSNPPTRKRDWQASVTPAMSGTEERVNTRSSPWVQMDYQVMPIDQVERAKFQGRFEAALKSGKIAVPFWGRSVELTMDAIIGDTTLHVDRIDAGMVATKFLFLQSFLAAEFETFDIVQIASVGSQTIQTTQPVSHSYLEGNRVWQLLFGKPIPQEASISNDTRTFYKVSLLYDARQVNTFSDDNFSGYKLGKVETLLDGGSGWGGPWRFG